MNKELLKQKWIEEEKKAKIIGWDFSYINERSSSEDLPWDYTNIVKSYLNDNLNILDYDTGGGEVLLSLKHPYNKTSATEGYEPNVVLCEEKLIPLGINFKTCDDPKNIPFGNESFDIIINRHGSFDVDEIYRLLKKEGYFITQQVGDDNDREFVDMVLPGLEKQFPNNNLKFQSNIFKNKGFEIIEAKEAYPKMRFFDIEAFIWFAKIIEWEFVGFSVEKCFNNLLEMQKIIDKEKEIVASTHRYLLVVKKK